MALCARPDRTQRRLRTGMCGVRAGFRPLSRPRCRHGARHRPRQARGLFLVHAHSDHWNPGWLEYKIPTARYIVDDSWRFPAVRRRIDPQRQALYHGAPVSKLDPVEWLGARTRRASCRGIEWYRTFRLHRYGSFFISFVWTDNWCSTRGTSTTGTRADERHTRRTGILRARVPAGAAPCV